jgi:predicted SPOUT superfamily RNA methylase MTH1
MRIHEFAKKLGIHPQTAKLMLKEGTEKILLNGTQWHVTDYACKKYLGKINTSNKLYESANYYLEDEIAITGEDNNEAMINLKQIKTNILNLINLINTNPDTNLSNIVMIFQSKETLDDIVNAINGYEQSVIQGDN